MLGLRTIAANNNADMKFVCSDAGTSLNHKLLASLGFPPIDIMNHPVKAQYKNFVEARIKIFGQLFKVAFRRTNEESKYSCFDGTVNALSFVFSALCLATNTIPYHTGEHFSPADIKYGSERTKFLLEENAEACESGKFFKKYAILTRNIVN